MKTILIADDNKAGRELMRAVFEPIGLRVIEASDGAEALAAIHREIPDIALVDIQMPKVDGFSLIAAVRSSPPPGNVWIIALTALAMDGDRKRILEAGFDGYIAKPISVPLLRSTVVGLLTNQRHDSQSAGQQS